MHCAESGMCVVTGVHVESWVCAGSGVYASSKWAVESLGKWGLKVVVC